MEHFLDIAFSGLLIGILISAPMGPIGVLVIQRTLNKGRQPAFYTGIGAALSDFIYCLLAGFGLSFVTDFIESNQNTLQIIGSLFMIAYGVYLFKANPSRVLKSNSTQTHTANTYWRDFATGFIFTFSNPLILFIILGLFARFNFMTPHFRFYHYIVGFLAIICGAILWWFSITFVVNKVRSHFNVRSMWLVNRVIAVALGAMGIFGLAMGIRAFTGFW